MLQADKIYSLILVAFLVAFKPESMEDEAQQNSKLGVPGLTVPGQVPSRSPSAKSTLRQTKSGLYYGGAGDIPAPNSYHKPNKIEREEGRANLAIMDEGRKQRLSKKMLIICAVVTAVVVVVIVVIAAIVATLPEPVEVSEVSALLRKYDAKEVALLPRECTITLVKNGECDWEIQNNPYEPCDYDRVDCRASLACLELTDLLNAKGSSEKCEKVIHLAFSDFYK